MRILLTRAAMLCASLLIMRTAEVDAQRKPSSPVKIPAPRDANYKNNYTKYVDSDKKFNQAYLINGEQITKMTKLSPTVRIYNAIDDKGQRMVIYVPVNPLYYDLWNDKLYAQNVTGKEGEDATADMNFNPEPITPISTELAQKYVWNYIGNKKMDDINSFVVNTQTLYLYMNRINSSLYVRYYHAMDDHGQRYLIVYGVDKEGKDMRDVQYLLDRTSICTKTCEGYEVPRPRTGLATK